MKINVVRIGNSRGIRIPKAVLVQCRLGLTVELEVKIMNPIERIAVECPLSFEIQAVCPDRV